MTVCAVVVWRWRLSWTDWHGATLSSSDLNCFHWLNRPAACGVQMKAASSNHIELHLQGPHSTNTSWLLIYLLIPAPEVISHQHYGMSADWWGLGCLIFEMTAGRPPFHARGEHPKASDMERRIQTEQEVYCDKFSREVKDLCSLVCSTASQIKPKTKSSIIQECNRVYFLVAIEQRPESEVGLPQFRRERSAVASFLQKSKLQDAGSRTRGAAIQTWREQTQY